MGRQNHLRNFIYKFTRERARVNFKSEPFQILDQSYTKEELLGVQKLVPLDKIYESMCEPDQKRLAALIKNDEDKFLAQMYFMTCALLIYAGIHLECDMKTKSTLTIFQEMNIRVFRCYGCGSAFKKPPHYQAHIPDCKDLPKKLRVKLSDDYVSNDHVFKHQYACSKVLPNYQSKLRQPAPNACEPLTIEQIIMKLQARDLTYTLRDAFETEPFSHIGCSFTEQDIRDGFFFPIENVLNGIRNSGLADQLLHEIQSSTRKMYIVLRYLQLIVMAEFALQVFEVQTEEEKAKCSTCTLGQQDDGRRRYLGFHVMEHIDLYRYRCMHCHSLFHSQFRFIVDQEQCYGKTPLLDSRHRGMPQQLIYEAEKVVEEGIMPEEITHHVKKYLEAQGDGRQVSEPGTCTPLS